MRVQQLDHSLNGNNALTLNFNNVVFLLQKMSAIAAFKRKYVNFREKFLIFFQFS